MRTRPPWWSYAAVWLTSGIFALAWVVMMMRDINELRGRKVYPTKAISLAVVLALVANVSLVFVGELPKPTMLIAIHLAVAVSLMLFLMIGPILVSRQIDKLLPDRPSTVVLVATSFCWFLSLALVQRRLNTAVRSQQL